MLAILTNNGWGSGVCFYSPWMLLFKGRFTVEDLLQTQHLVHQYFARFMSALINRHDACSAQGAWDLALCF